MSVKGKRVFITGGSHGIGAATAVAFGREGCFVGINCCRNREGAEATLRDVRAAGGDGAVYQGDVASAETCERMLTEFIERAGGIDVLINNAGGALKIPAGYFEQMPLEYWNYQVDLNLNSAAYTSRVAVRWMKEHGVRGKIINVASIHAFVTWVKRKLLPYMPGKAGLVMFTKGLAAEVGRFGINVNCIAPGLIMTKLAERYSPEDLAAFQRKIPLGRPGRVEDITPLMLFLADDEKSAFITGQTFTVDGGQSIDGGIDSMLDGFEK